MAAHGHFIKPQAEEVVIAGMVGALVVVTVTSLLTAGADGYLPSSAASAVSFARMTLFWLSVIGGAAAGAWYGLRQERDTHLSGSRYYREPDEARAALQRVQAAAMSEAQREHKITGITLGGVEFARAEATGHFYISGLTRSGKTTVIRAIFQQALARGDRVILHDFKGDFVESYYRPEDSVILGPWDPRAMVWDASADVADATLASEFASMIFDTKNAGLKDPHWYIAAAHVLGGVIRAHMRAGDGWTWTGLQRELAGDPIALIQTAARGDSTVRQHFATCFPAPGSDREPTITPEQASILSTMADKVDWIAGYAAVDAAAGASERFSFVHWLAGTAHQDVRKVFLNYSSRNASAAEQIFGAMLATVAAIVEDPDTPDRSADAPDALWVILDEFAQLGGAALKATQSISELGRSRGVRAVIATQTPDQIVARLGAEKSKPVLQQQATRIYMRAAPETAEQIAKTVGTHQLERITTTASNGAISGKLKTTITEHTIQPGDLTGLKVLSDGVELVMHMGDILGRLVQPFGPKLPKIAPAALKSAVWSSGSLPTDEPKADPAAAAPTAPERVLATPTTATEEADWAGDYHAPADDAPDVPAKPPLSTDDDNSGDEPTF